MVTTVKLFGTALSVMSAASLQPQRIESVPQAVPVIPGVPQHPDHHDKINLESHRSQAKQSEPSTPLLENFGSRGCVAVRMKVLHGPLHSELCLYDSV